MLGWFHTIPSEQGKDPPIPTRLPMTQEVPSPVEWATPSSLKIERREKNGLRAISNRLVLRRLGARPYPDQIRIFSWYDRKTTGFLRFSLETTHFFFLLFYLFRRFPISLALRHFTRFTHCVYLLACSYPLSHPMEKCLTSNCRPPPYLRIQSSLQHHQAGSSTMRPSLPERDESFLKFLGSSF